MMTTVGNFISWPGALNWREKGESELATRSQQSSLDGLFVLFVCSFCFFPQRHNVTTLMACLLQLQAKIKPFLP